MIEETALSPDEEGEKRKGIEPWPENAVIEVLEVGCVIDCACANNAMFDVANSAAKHVISGLLDFIWLRCNADDLGIFLMIV